MAGSFLGKGPVSHALRTQHCVHHSPRRTLRDPETRGVAGGHEIIAQPYTRGLRKSGRLGHADFASCTSPWSLRRGCLVVHFLSLSTICWPRRLRALTTSGPCRL